MTLGNMRHLGVQRLIASRLNPKCRHDGLIEVFGYPPETGLTIVRNQAEGEPFTSHIRGGDSGYWIDGQRCGPLRRRHSGKPRRSQALPVDPTQISPAEQGERAMPMLFWLPMIFASALWEMNGFPPQSLANNHPALV
jgi:hypothetical protein